MQSETDSAKTADNGVNVDALLEAREAVKDTPEAAKFRWQARCDWVNGTHARSTVKEFHGLGDAQEHNKSFVFDSDHPEVFASEDNGITPVEYVLVGLAGCLTAGVASVAQNRNIQLQKVSAIVEGNMDLRGILGASKEVRNGYDNVNVRFDIEADATADEIEAIVAQSQKRSAVFDILANPVNVQVTVE